MNYEDISLKPVENGFILGWRETNVDENGEHHWGDYKEMIFTSDNVSSAVEKMMVMHRTTKEYPLKVNKKSEQPVTNG